LHGPRELDAVGMDNVSDESEHSNASVPEYVNERTLS
jgi:hypothetical protein